MPSSITKTSVLIAHQEIVGSRSISAGRSAATTSNLRNWLCGNLCFRVNPRHGCWHATQTGRASGATRRGSPRRARVVVAAGGSTGTTAVATSAAAVAGATAAHRRVEKEAGRLGDRQNGRCILDAHGRIVAACARQPAAKEQEIGPAQSSDHSPVVRPGRANGECLSLGRGRKRLQPLS